DTGAENNYQGERNQPAEKVSKEIPMTYRLAAIVALLSAGSVLAQTPKELRGHTDKIHSVAFSADGKTLATAGFDNLVQLWEYPSGKEIRPLTVHTAPFYCAAFSPDGKPPPPPSHDKTIRLWNAADGKTIRELKGHGDIVDSVAFSPDGKLLA